MYPWVNVNLSELNYVDIKPNPSVIRESYEVTILNCVPRPAPGYHTRLKEKKVRTPWTFPISLFRDYIPDSEVLLGIIQWDRRWWQNASRRIGVA